MKYAEDAQLDVQYLELDYWSNHATMLIILPKKKNGLRDLEKKLTSDTFKRLKESTSMTKKVDLSLPKFAMDAGFDLLQIMRKIGVTQPFEPSTANFTEMATGRRIFVGSGFHKTFISVDEQGTEAAAASAFMMMAGASMQRPEIVQFKADHPFMFAIRHNPTMTMMFVGRVEKF